MSPPHQTFVKFTGSGHRAHCMTRGCNFVGTHHTMMRHLAQGHSQSSAWYRTKTMAEDDARRHRLAEERRRT